MRVLLIEDNIEFAHTIKDFLQSRYIVDLVHEGERGEYLAFINDYDLIILDIILPDISGVRVCEKIRSNNISTPILFLTARHTVNIIVKALDTGGDDYIVKPFKKAELLARMRALLRRSNTFNNHIYKCGDFVLDTSKRNVMVGKKQIYLRRKEFDLLEYLVRNSNHTITRSMILEHVWEGGMDKMSNTVDVHIKHLRDKVEKALGTKVIKTIHGLGYTFSQKDLLKGGELHESYHKKNSY